MKYFNLEEMLKENLTANNWSNLPIILEISRTKLSRLLSGTDSWEFSHIYNLYKLTNIPSIDIINIYSLKKYITTDEMDILNKDFPSLQLTESNKQ
jgi:hypothetical protein